MHDMVRKKEDDEDSDSVGSDSNPSGDQYTEKEKAETFLNPQTAAKIGLSDVKIASRSVSPKKMQRKKSS